MDTNKLFLFSKNTDAVAAQRGYNYQTLKTLETWVENFLEQRNEEIYCEYEEDIFQKDDFKKELTFRQIKLYSNGFSFSSEEIKKSIGHFFTLQAKFDNSDFSKEFIFETNANIKGKYKDNDAELLKEWFEKQNNLDEGTLIRIAEKIKEIVSEYIYGQNLGKFEQQTLGEALGGFHALDEKYWQTFVKMIKFKFLSVSPDVEFEAVRIRIQELIAKLPHPSLETRSDLAFGVLLDQVFRRLTEEKGEDRKLTNNMLEQAILNMGSTEDQWYARRFEYYKSIQEINEFRIGEYYEIIDLVNYCRRKLYLHGHKLVWNRFIFFYSRSGDVLDNFRRKAIYELIFLNNEFYETDYENLGRKDRPAGSLIGLEEDIRFYFGDLSFIENSDDLENAKIILNLLVGAISNKVCNIGLDELKDWFIALYRKISKKLQAPNDINEQCNLLEQKGMVLMGINRIRKRSAIEFLRYFNSMLDLVPDAPLFQLSRFGERIEKYIQIQIHHDPQDKSGITAALEDFSEKLFPLLEKREGRIQLAKSQVKRGYSYLKTSESKNMLKSLDYFHKAKENYLLEDTIEGYILALLNIAQIYNALGMHFAAKQYGLAAYRMATNKEMLHRVENSLAILLHADYRSGSWFNALNVYRRYIGLRLESNFDKTDSSEEISCTQDAAFLLYVMKRSSGQFDYLIKSYLAYLDYVGDEIIEPLHNSIDAELAREDDYLKAIQYQFVDYPLNDIGKVRMISFYALGSLWKIKFENSYDGMALFEEYISAVQIILAEIALSEVDFHFIKSQIDITLELGRTYHAPEQQASNEVIKWKVYVCRTDTREIRKMNYHAAFLMVSLKQILKDISLLPSDELETLIDLFLRESKLDTKQLVVNLYQKIHRDVYLKGDFEALKPGLFAKEDFPELSMPRENRFMTWNDSLSKKYNRDFSIEAIKNRFNNIHGCTYLTIEELKKNAEFPVWVNQTREKGWKDWQIMSNIQNFMINYKVRVFEGGQFSTEEAFLEHYQKMFHKYTHMDERDSYVEFPLEAFQSEEFDGQFDISLPSTLRTYGLETNQSTPNFKAIREFLDIRFNIANDDYQENNPLYGIV